MRSVLLGLLAGCGFFSGMCPSMLYAQLASYAEAKAEIDRFWAKHGTRCGDVFAVRFVSGEIEVFKGGQWSIQTSQLSRADTLNGIQWRGGTALSANSTRSWFPKKGWEAWQDGTGFGAFDVSVVKANGAWNLTPNRLSAINHMIPPRCSDIPRDLTTQERQQSESAQAQAYCAQAQRFVIGAADAFIQRVKDVNSCKDGQGRTLLMLNLANAPYGFSSNAYSLIRSGADLNVKDASGFSALRYAITQYNQLILKGTSVADEFKDIIREMVARGANREDLVSPNGDILEGTNSARKSKKLPQLVVFTYDQGSFRRQADGSWLHVLTTQSIEDGDKWSPLGEDATWIYIRDDNRNRSMRIPKNGGWSAWQGGPFRSSGDWIQYRVVERGQ